jgi:hypothetical protein
VRGAAYVGGRLDAKRQRPPLVGEPHHRVTARVRPVGAVESTTIPLRWFWPVAWVTGIPPPMGIFTTSDPPRTRKAPGKKAFARV